MKRRILILLSIPLVTAALVCLAVAGFLSLESGRNFVAGQIERLVSDDEFKLEIGRIKGSLFSSFAIDSVKLQDRDGVWLEISEASFEWSPIQAFTGGGLRINVADVERLNLDRLPRSTESSTGSAELSLPVILFLEKFSIGEINVSESLIGIDASFSLDGNAVVPSLNDEISLEFTAARLGGVGGILQFQGSFNPSNDRLALDLDLSEDSGGLVSSYLNLRDKPSLNFTIKGEGVLSDWSGDFGLKADNDSVLEGAVTTVLVEDGVAIDATLDGGLEQLAPLEYSELLSGRIGLDIEAKHGGDGTTSISSFTLSTDGVNVNGSGVLDGSGIPESMSVRFTANSQLSPVLASLGIEDLGFSTGNVSLEYYREGDRNPWILSGEFANVDWYENEFQSVSIKANGELVDVANEEFTQLPFDADVEVHSPGKASGTIHQVVGESLNLTVDGNISTDGLVRIDKGLLKNWLGEFDVSLEFDGSELSVAAKTVNADLSNLSEFFDMEFGGNADIVANAKFDFAKEEYHFELDSQTTDASLGLELVDSLITGPGELAGIVRGRFDFEEYEFVEFKVDTSSIELSSQGVLSGYGLDIDLDSELRNLAAFDANVGGALAVSGSMEGEWEAPVLKLDLNSDLLNVLDYRFEGVSGKLDLTADSTDPKGSLALNGKYSNIPIEARANLNGYLNGGYSINDIQITGENLMASGNAILMDSGLAEGNFVLASSELKELGVLFSTELGGALNAEVDLSIDSNRQAVSAAGVASELTATGFGAESVQFELSVLDATDVSTVAGSVSAVSVKVNDYSVEDLNVTIERQEEISAFALSALAFDTEFDLHGGVDWQQEQFLVNVDSSEINHKYLNLSLIDPVEVLFQDGVFEFGQSKWQGGGAEIEVRGKTDEKIHIDLEQLPLNIAGQFAPNLELDGDFSGKAVLDLSNEDFHMTWNAKVSNASSPILQENGLYRFSAEGSGKIDLSETVIGAEGLISIEGETALSSREHEKTKGANATELGIVGGTLQLKGSFNPSNDRLAVDLELSEDSGGVVSTFMGLQENSSLKFTVKGDGVIRDWSCDIRLKADNATVAEGTVKTGLEGDDLALDASLEGNLEHVVPSEYAELLSGGIGLEIEARIGADGTTNVSNFTLSTDMIDAKGAGMLDGSGNPDSISFQIATNSELRPVLSLIGLNDIGFSAGNANLEFHREDEKNPWSFAGSFADLDWNGNAIESVSLNASGELVDAASGGFIQLPFEAELRIDSPDLVNGTAQKIAGESLNLTVDGNYSLDGSVQIDSGLLNNWLGTYNFSLEFAGSELSVDARTRNADLANLSEIFDLETGGEAEISATSKMNFTLGEYDLKIEAWTTDASVGFEQIDNLIAGRGELTGKVNGDFEFNEFAVTEFKIGTPNLDFTIKGDLEDGSLDLDMASELHNLAALDARAEGTLAMSGNVKGTWNAPVLLLELKSDRVKMHEYLINGVNGRLDLTADPTDPRGAIALNGMHVELPFEARASLKGYENGGYSIGDIQFTGANLMADGHAILMENGLVDGKFNLATADLNGLGKLLATELGGKMDAEVDLSIENNRQMASITGTASELASTGYEAGSARFEASVSDVTDVSTFAGNIAASNVKLNEYVVEDVKASFEPKGGLSSFSLNALAFDTEFDLQGSMLWQQDALHINLDSSDISHNSLRLSLSDPVDATFHDGVFEFETSDWKGGNTRISVKGKTDEKIHFEVENLPLTVAGIFAPNLELEGSAAGEAVLDFSKEDFHMIWDATVNNTGIPILQENGLSHFNATGKGEITEGKAGFEVRVSNDQEFFLNIEGDVELDSLILDCKLKGEIPLQTADLMPVFLSEGISMDGKLLVDLSAKGEATFPKVLGSIRIREGEFNYPEYGIFVSNLSVEAESDGSKLILSNLKGILNESGDIEGSGYMEIDPENSFPSSLRIAITDGEYVRDQLLSMTFSSELLIEGPLLTEPTITGKLDISRMEIQIPERLPGGYSDIDILHVAAPERVIKQTQIVRGEIEPADQMTTPFNAFLKIDITAPDSGFLVRGRGMLAEMGGQIRVEGTDSDVEVEGSFSMIRGRLYIFGKNLTFQRGIVTFTGNFNPELDFISETTVADTTIIVSVKGVVSDPEFTFASEPELPQDEILALLLFNRSLDQLSSIQIATLAAQIASLTSNLPVGLDTVRSTLGIDVLDFRTDKEGNAVVEVGKYLNDNIYFGVTDTDEASSVAVDIDITSTLKGRGEIDDLGESRVGIDFNYDY